MSAKKYLCKIEPEFIISKDFISFKMLQNHTRYFSPYANCYNKFCASGCDYPRKSYGIKISRRVNIIHEKNKQLHPNIEKMCLRR